MTAMSPGELIRSGSPAAPPTPRHAHAGELMRRLGEPLIGGNRVELLEDGPATFAAMYRAIEGARDHVNIESYIVEADGPGEEIARRLADRCADGVRVNLLFDSFGSLTTSSAFFSRLRRSGVSLCEYNPLHPWRALAGLALQRRDHRKLMVVDGRIGFIGGVNISPVYRSGSSPGAGGRAGWRDLHVQVEGPVVQRLQRLFIAHWQRHADAPMQQARYFRPLAPAGTHRVGVVASDAGARRDPYFSALLGAIDTARQRVLLTTAYLAPPRRLLRRLVEAARRGVQVEMLVPGVSDSWAALHAGRSHYGRLLRAGVRIHERHDTQLHAKACVIDGVWASIGSSNIDWRSLLHNAEANLVVLDEDFAAQVERVFRADAALAETVDLPAWEQRSAWHRLRETVARRFEFLL
jgi:cardiolipin synthase